MESWVIEATAWGVILLAWIIGGAAVFHGSSKGSVGFIDVLLGWTLLNGLVVVAAGLATLLAWAISVVIA